MTDYIQNETETDNLVDQTAAEHEKAKVFFYESDDLSLEQALKIIQKVARKIEEMG